MRWFKHISYAAQDEKLANLLSEYGPEIYGIWWLVVEVVARQMDKTDRCEMEYTEGIWAKELFISKAKTHKILTVFCQKNLIFLETSGKKILVRIPKLLELRDEYSKRSGVCP